MNCESWESQLLDHLEGTLSTEAEQELALHLESCASCRAEAQELSQTWAALGALPPEEPGIEVRNRFYDFLAEAEVEARRRRPRFGERLAALWPRQPALQAALVAVALGAGFLLGTSGRRGEIGELRGEVRSLHHMVALSLLDRDSASERLRGVSFTQSGDSADPAVLDALLDAVRNDPSVNVRLAAIDALAPRAGGAPLRKELLAALAHESSPLVQVAIGDAVLSADGAEAKRELAQVVDQAKLDPKVKDYLVRRVRGEA